MKIAISNIQNFCVHDGPGIRTVFFLSGCPLRCKWCHNPETWESSPTIAFEKERCILCKGCNVCLQGVHTFRGEHLINRSLCKRCGRCIENCPTKAISFTAREYEEREILEIIDKQSAFFGDVGGVTFSGGEPLTQWERVSRLCKKISVSKAVETCGYTGSETFKKMLSDVDYVMMDIKLYDESQHIKYTGVSNKPILENLKLLKESGIDCCIRTPLIPGITDTEENLSGIQGIIGDLPWEKLPYNAITPQKYERLGMTFSLS
ncbi:MAG: glycyl-radical enzyme activating protein [Ruminococcaceae bacterium]|nr:glycyl-radical enzyme activating protein [Oscillospiraceae bacterium]